MGEPILFFQMLANSIQGIRNLMLLVALMSVYLHLYELI